ncbi:MAG: hypothetical protein M3Q06_12215 [Bacteroidota bacterium]|nr:hypothetical protein [Bacteroidota bacterium]
MVSQERAANTALSKVPNVTRFQVNRQGRAIALTWSAVAGLGKFHVERSYDGKFFEVIEEIENTGACVYTCSEENMPSGYVYYRICSVDINNKEQWQSAEEVVRIL